MSVCEVCFQQYGRRYAVVFRGRPEREDMVTKVFTEAVNLMDEGELSDRGDVGTVSGRIADEVLDDPELEREVKDVVEYALKHRETGRLTKEKGTWHWKVWKKKHLDRKQCDVFNETIDLYPDRQDIQGLEKEVEEAPERKEEKN